MITNIRTLTDAFDKNLLLKEGYTDIWAQSISDTVIGNLVDAELNVDFLLEARIIGSGKELHIFEYQDFASEERLKAVETIMEDGDNYIDTRKQYLRKKYGEYIVLRHYLGKDRDGQIYIVRTVLNSYGKGDI